MILEFVTTLLEYFKLHWQMQTFEGLAPLNSIRRLQPPFHFLCMLYASMRVYVCVVGWCHPLTEQVMESLSILILIYAMHVVR